MKVVAEKWGCEPKRMPSFSALDYALIRDKKVHAMAEIKYRKTSYPTIMLSLTKLMEAYLYQRMGVKSFFILGLAGKVSWLDLNGTLPESIEWGGRNGRGHDEPVAMFRLEDFSEF